MPDVIILQ